MVRLPLRVRSRGRALGCGVKGGEIGWWEGGLCERFVLRWLLLPIYKRQAGKARTLGFYLGEGRTQLCFLHIHLIRSGAAACGTLARPRADWGSFGIRFLLGSVSR